MPNWMLNQFLDYRKNLALLMISQLATNTLTNNAPSVYLQTYHYHIYDWGLTEKR